MLRHGVRHSKQWHGLKKCQMLSVMTLMIMILMALILLFSNKREHTNTMYSVPELKWKSFPSSVELLPTVEFKNGTEVIWQIPVSPKAVIFLAHGCSGRAINFWDRSSSCPNCVGLPEERLIVLHALARKFAVLTISSTGRCWSLGDERLLVKDIIKWWVEKNKLEKLPLMALGASSGGYFVSKLATDMIFNGVTLMIAEGVFGRMNVPDSYPPTLFVHMPKDRTRMRLISENMKALRQKGIHVAEIKCSEFPLTPNLLCRVPGLSQSVSQGLFELFHEKGFIDQNAYMRNDGRATHWKEALKERKTLLSETNELIPHIQEELNLAFAFHEMTSLQSKEIFSWFESLMK